jgi:arylsulfatase A-like enzyme
MTKPAAGLANRSQPTSPALPPASPATLLAAAIVAVALLWLPLSVIPILDGLLFVASPLEVLRDLGLLWWLGLLPALAMAATAWLLARLARAAGARGDRAHLTAWCVMLLPLTWVIGWLSARTAWQWARTLVGSEMLVTQEMRAVAVVLLAGALAWGLWRLTLRTAVARVAATLYGAWPAAAALLTLAAVPVAMRPPALLSGASAADAAVAASGPARPDIIMISLDAVAAADADACNPGSATMPRLARFARGAGCFTRFYAASNFTTPTTSTMETGLLPWSHFATQPDAKMTHATRGHTLAAVLQAQGWRTHSITDNLLASPRHRGTFAAYTSSGFAGTTLFGNSLREAMTVFPETALPRLVAMAASFLGAFDMALHGAHSPYNADRTYTRLLALLSQEPRGKPLFVWAHTLPPHSPYLPPASTRYRLLPKGELETWRQLMPDNVDYASAAQPLVDKHRLRYRESMMAADAALGAFLDELERQGRLDAALVVVTSDHGESFEKGFLGHAGALTHDTLIRVPLVIKLPGQKLGQVVRTPVSQADLAPTLLDLAGAPALARAEGRSLRAALEGRPMEASPAFAMTMERQNRFQPLAHGRFVVIDGDEKLTLTLDPPHADTTTLFNLAADPAEAHDLAAAMPARAGELQALLRKRLAGAEQARHAVASTR